MGNANGQATTDPPVSKFYLACRSGDVDAVKQVLPTMQLKELNRVEPNGSTALHVAAWYGHFEIVELLLKRGCSTTTTNKYGKTAAQECENERTQQLLRSSGTVVNNDEDTNERAPKSKWCQLYENIDNQNKSALAMKIMKLRLRTYLTNQFKTNGENRTDHLMKLILESIGRQHSEYERVSNILKKFERDHDPSHLIYIYTIECPFYRYIHDKQDEVFYMELLIGLMVFKNRFYNGVAYRGNCMNKEDLDFYRWAWHHPESFIEMRTIWSTSVNRRIAEKYTGNGLSSRNTVGVFFILHFTERCETAIDLREISPSTLSLSDYVVEEEILIIPGTFFEVTSIDQTPNHTIIELKHIPVSRDILLKTINEVK